MNKDILVAGALAMDIEWANPEVNLNVVEDYVRRFGQKLDLLILPELFTTAFAQDIDVLKELAEDDEGHTMSLLKNWSREYDLAICGSYLAVIDGSFFNRGFIILPTGNCLFYNKRHLFGLSAESRLFTAGSDLPDMIEFKGWRLALVVCYDLRFPVWCRCRGESCHYDLLMVVANWPLSREYAWNHLLIARAIENQSYVIGCDRSGRDDFGAYDDMCVVFDSAGKPVGCDVHDMLYVAQLSHGRLYETRQRWPFSNDADRFHIL